MSGSDAQLSWTLGPAIGRGPRAEIDPRAGGGAPRARQRSRALLRLGLTRREAADALGMSLNSFERHVQPHIRLVRTGKLRIVPIKELERWLEENARLTLESERRSA